MENFTKINLIERRNMAIDELVKYYAEYRKYKFINGYELRGIAIRKKINFIIKLILKIDQVLSKEEIIVISDRHNKNNDVPKIYACTHIGGNDIQRTFQVIKTPAYLMLGDPGILYRMPIYQGLKLNGVIPLETGDREDRKIAYHRSIELLKKGGNLLIYPEGAWNVSPNSIVMKTFNGAVRMAMETGAEIVPIGVEQYDKKFYFNIGKEYNISCETQKSVDELNGELRDKLAKLKWEIMELQPILQRKEIPYNYVREFQEEIINRCNYGYGFSLEDALRESFHDKDITTEEVVFSFLEDLDLNENNAFLAKDKREYILKKNR